MKNTYQSSDSVSLGKGNRTTRSQRINARQDKIWESIKSNERDRIARGEEPNPNLTEMTAEEKLFWEKRRADRTENNKKGI